MLMVLESLVVFFFSLNFSLMFLLFFHLFNDIIVSGCAASFLFHGLSFVAETQGSSLLLELRLLNAVASLVLECGLEGVWASVAVVHGLGCSTARGILLDQGSNPCPLHWQVDSLPRSHPGKPRVFLC